MQGFSEHKIDDKNEEFLQWLKLQWNIEFKCVRRDIDIQGSPERTLSRVVLQDKDGTLFLLEKFSKRKFQIRHTVAKAIEYLNDNGLKAALLYQKSNSGEFLPFFKDACFQLSFFLDSTGIENPEGLGMPMVMTFLKEIRAKKLYSKTGWRFFPEYVLALRFAWLSEWLRKEDKDMLEMEEAYMGILVDNMEVLRQG